MLKLCYKFFNRPHVGILGAIGTDVSFSLHRVLTDELLLKEATGMGVYIGVGVATISLVTGVIRLADMIVKRVKSYRNAHKKAI